MKRQTTVTGGGAGLVFEKLTEKRFYKAVKRVGKID